MADGSGDEDARRAARVGVMLWALASAAWILIACVPLRRPEGATLEAARAFIGDLPITLADGHRIIDTWWPETAVLCVSGFLLLRWPRTWPTQARLLRRARSLLAAHPGLLIVLGCALVARVALAHRGGQYFDWDEHRYGVGATTVLLALSQADWHGAMDALFRLPAEHTGFRIVGLVPALVQTVPAWWNGRSLVEMHAPAGEWAAAATLSACSVVVIAEVYWLALKVGAERREAFLAALLTACSTTLFFYSRHFFPYDAALAIALAALGIGLHGGASFRSFVSGLLTGFAFLVYNGYWTLVPVVGVTQALFGRRPGREIVSRLWLFGAGALVFPALFLLGGHTAGAATLQDALRFSTTVTNGDYDAGAVLPWQFLWHAEHGLLLLWGLGAAVLVWPAARSRDDGAELRRGRLWLVLAAAFYLCLVIPSNVLHKFVVYDRAVRPLVPLLCLAGAGAATIVVRARRRVPWFALISALAIGQAAWNARPLFALQFPREVANRAAEQYGTELADGGNSFLLSFLASPDQVPSTVHRYSLVNGGDIWITGDRLPVAVTFRGRVIYRTTHPRQLFIYQYHGYTERLRTVLRHLDLSIQLIDRQQ